MSANAWERRAAAEIAAPCDLCGATGKRKGLWARGQQVAFYCHEDNKPTCFEQATRRA